MTGHDPGLVRCRAVVEVEITVDVDVATEQSFSEDVCQAVQDAIGHTGAKVIDSVDWTFLSEEAQARG